MIYTTDYYIINQKKDLHLPRKIGPIVQWIERKFPKLQIQVRFLVGLPSVSYNILTIDILYDFFIVSIIGIMYMLTGINPFAKLFLTHTTLWSYVVYMGQALLK